MAARALLTRGSLPDAIPASLYFGFLNLTRGRFIVEPLVERGAVYASITPDELYAAITADWLHAAIERGA